MKTQLEKSINTINLQPQRITSTIEQILALDVVGTRTNRIAELLRLTESRVSIIKNCPMYQDRIKVMRKDMRTSVIDKHSDKIVSDPARDKLFGLKTKAVQVYEDVIDDDTSSAFAKLNAANQVCDRTDLRPQQAEKSKQIIQITQKLGDRFVKALTIKEVTVESTDDARVAKTGTEEEVPS